MEDKIKMETPSSRKHVWSPYPNYDGKGVTSTPYWSLSYNKLNESEGSSKQDSGYCSVTPKSADSAGLLFGNCCQCNMSIHRSYAQSSPESLHVCSCDKLSVTGVSPNLEVIKEVKMSPTPLTTRSRLNRPLTLYEDAMDTSLYTEDMEVDPSPSMEAYQCSLDCSELGEENSIDFLEPDVLCGSQNSVKDSPSISLSPKHTVFPEASKSKGFDRCIDKLFNSEDFFSPEIFNSDLVSPKLKNEITPTKFKRATPSSKKKKSSFLSSAKKVTTINRVLRSFYLNGIESVDFFYQLGVKRNLGEIVSQIFKLLPEKDLDSVRIVSKAWNRLLNNDADAYNRLKRYRNEMKMMKENFFSPVKQGGSGERDRPVLSRLQNVGNQTSPSRQLFSPQQSAVSPPVSPSSIKFASYQKAAKSLKKHERLLPCPICRFPSTDRGSPVAQCPRSGCRHRFCVWCNMAVVPGKDHNCPPLYTPRCVTRRNTTHSVGSKSSKRNLRRL